MIYWFHGYSERYNKPVSGTPHRNYDEGTDYGGDNIANFVSTHEVIVVKWDGYNPRKPGEDYPRPYNIQPVETNRQFPLYFPELVNYIDETYRTLSDRGHRATSGLSMGGFMSFWIAGKYPDLVSSASNFMGSSEFLVGPREFPVEYRHEEMRGNYEGLRTRLVTGTQDFIRFYHRRMNLIWNFTNPHHETEEFDSDHGTPGMPKTLAFHMAAFGNPLPAPAVWNHIDAYPEFSVWGWRLDSDRRRPGLTQLSNVSASGFRSCVREWVPDGRAMPEVKFKITSNTLYPAGKEQTITTVRLRDGAVSHTKQKADAKGRLTFALDGDEYETGIGEGPILTFAGFEIENAAWAEDGQPIHLRVRVYNKGSRPSAPVTLHWETPNANVSLSTANTTVLPLPSGEMAAIPLAFTIADSTREIAKFFAISGGTRLALEVPMFPPAAPIPGYQIADGRPFRVFEHAVEARVLSLGSGNADGRANSGERIAILIRDGDAWRAAELFTNDPCIDLATRVSDSWGTYDHVGASVKYSLPSILGSCSAGHVIRMLARIQLPDKPDHRIRYGAVEFPVH